MPKSSRAAPKGSNPNNTFDAIFPGSVQKLTFNGTSAPSTAFGTDVSVVRFFATQNCYLKFGATPVAAATDMYLPAGVIEYFAVTPGQKVAAIQDSTTGVLHICEGSTS
jgi:hypothetical protein